MLAIHNEKRVIAVKYQIPAYFRENLYPVTARRFWIQTFLGMSG